MTTQALVLAALLARSPLCPAADSVTDNRPTAAWVVGRATATNSRAHSFRPGQRIEKQVVVRNDAGAPRDYSLKWKAVVNGKEIAAGEDQGQLRAGEVKLVPLTFVAPMAADLPQPKADGEIGLEAKIGDREHSQRFAFRIHRKPGPPALVVTCFDPVGRTAKLLEQIGIGIADWDGRPAPGLLVIGREVLSRGIKLPAALDYLVGIGGRVLVMGQDPEWTRTATGLRVAGEGTNAVVRISPYHAVASGLDEEDLRDWAGGSGIVCGGPIEKPYPSGWRPILECGPNLAYTPLMELEYGSGRLLWCALDLEDHVAADPVAERLAQQIVYYAATGEMQRRAAKVAYLGGDAGAALLDKLGVAYARAEALGPEAALTIVGPDAALPQAEALGYIRNGGKLFSLAQSKPEGLWKTSLRRERLSDGIPEVPNWPECRGISPSDLRLRLNEPVWVLADGCEVGAGGLVGRIPGLQGGVAVLCQLAPEQAGGGRAFCQLLANLGAAFSADEAVFGQSTRPAR